ncbi:MAG: tripartite tricarboxylate transporter substrate binding protein [Pseudomonadota bacterium]
MVTKQRRAVLRAAVCLPLAGIVSAGIGRSAQAQTAAAWPTRGVRWVVPFAPGGAADALARLMALKLTEKWGQTVLVDNKPGANTVIGATEVMRAPPDGYTLFQAINSTLTLNPHTFSKLAYDPIRDFSHIALLGVVPIVLVSNAALPAKTIPELVALAKARPGTISMGGGSVGIQLAVERFSRDAGIKFAYVPYKSGIEVTRGLLSGEIQVGMDASVQYPAFVKEGKLRILATNSPQRVPSLPDVPTLAESGYRNSEIGLWHAMLAPVGLAPDIRQKIEADIRVVLAMPDVVQKLSSLGIEAMWGSSEQVVKLIQTESAAMAPLVKELGLKMD